jgi:hypothetical protein
MIIRVLLFELNQSPINDKYIIFEKQFNRSNEFLFLQTLYNYV